MKQFGAEQTKYRICDHCDKSKPEFMLQRDGSFWLCPKCKEYMDKTYAEEMRKELTDGSSQE